jgi:hypothetical protein
VLLILPLCLVLTAAPASNRKEAAAHFSKAQKLAQAGNDAAALVEFKAAYDASPTWEVLYEVGLAERRLAHFAPAMAALTRYLDEGGAKVPKDRRARAQRELTEIHELTATVRIRLEGAPARIFVDGELVGLTPLQPLLVPGGRHTFRAERDGTIDEETVDLVARKDTDVALAPKASEDTQLAELTVDSSPQGAVVTVDGALLGMAPTKAKLAAGAHEIVAELDGYPTKRTSVQLDAGQSRTVSLQFDPETEPRRADNTTDAAPRSRFPLAGVIVSVVGLGLVGGGVGLNVSAHTQARLVSELYRVGGTWDAQAQAAQAAGLSAQTWSWVLTIGGAAVLATGVVLTVVTLAGNRPSEEAALWVAPSLGGFVVGGAW